MPFAVRFILGLLAFGNVGNALAALTADYQFQHTLTSTVGAAPALTDVGPGTNGFAIETVDGKNRTVLTFPRGNGLQLAPTTGVTTSSTYTIVLLARLLDTTNFRRYIDFKNGSSDTGLYNSSGRLVFYDFAQGAGTPITANSYRQVVITRDVTATVVGYVDGVQQFTFNDSGGGGIITANTLRFFVDDATVSGEDSAGAVARIRVFDTALTPDQVAALGRAPAPAPAGAVVPVPTLSPIALLVLMLLLGAVVLAAGRARRSPR
ncbi:MAG: IPTL-CTERM sorting domain-containing protein [Lamprocystis purpurea]|jgi:hypothetical protein|uniref:IPTL-CTERM sorting domain-containing protein n=1 Tax=Lamprocystis purpurea TaxID=61598 RepID=UPI000375E453|nr:IPTL-CTERM sorting domain-containing protein [Lamprocystis purpurea]MBV5275091.1 IPTL-CTERM sorting domain-containing protein [Lamprocystis purpurea]